MGAPSTGPRAIRLALGLLALLMGTGCTTGGIYTRITVPLDLDADATVYHRHDDAESADSLNLDVVRITWGGNGLAQVAREHGFESIAYADHEILKVLGIWRQDFAIIYGRLASGP